jgi:hypothetical protein
LTLPFRRRHHDDDGAHDRAHSLASRELLEPLADDESAWLTRHLEGCADCRRERDGYRADHALLRSLRDRAPEPPRDLWARTAAALDQEARRHRRSAGAQAPREGRRTPRRFGWSGLPLGAAAGILILIVVIGPAIVWPQVPAATPGGSTVAVNTRVPAPTPMSVAALPVSFIRANPDGSWELVYASIDEVCPRTNRECLPNLDEEPPRHLNLGSRPSTVTISPDQGKLVVEDPGDASHPGRIVVVPVASSAPTVTAPPDTAPPSIGPDDTPTPVPPTPDPSDAATASPELTPAPTPVGQVEIASGVTVVGEVAYSEDGQWLAFSAMPSDGATGPDLYLWHVGDAKALAVTSDHATYFSAWLGDQILASQVQIVAEPGESGEPGASVTPGESGEPSPDSSLPAEPVEAHPTSFLLDPATLARTDVAQAGVWLPVVDPTGRFVVYWSGTVRSYDGLTWALGTGNLVLDGWTEGSPTDPEATATPDPAAASTDPGASAAPVVGPAGAPTTIVPGTTAAFKARFDPTGTRLAVWIDEDATDDLGRLHLLVLDAESGAIDPELAPLPGTPALPRFSIDQGRLAWVSPSGQDGNESAVQVLGWTDDDFGEIKTTGAQDLYILD